MHAALLELVSGEDVAPVIGRVIGMDEVATTLEDHAQRRTSGRTVVDVTLMRSVR